MTRRIVHGTHQAYFWHDCRCDRCCDAQAQRVARSRRCDPCKDARREAYARLEKRQT